MFVQVIQGQVAEPDAAHAALDQWAKELAHGASGWLGTTAGVTDDGVFVALARFESEEAARRNSERPEQSTWWEETSRLFTGEVTFHDSTEVDVDVYGDPGQAEFIQVMQGRTTDADRARELMADDSVDWPGYRPDILGSVSAGYGDGEYTLALYFTSEEAAREGESKEPPPELMTMMQEMDALTVGETRYFDLRHPWMYAPE